MSGGISLDRVFVERWQKALAADREAAVRGHRCSVELCIYVDEIPLQLSIQRGVIVNGETGPWHMRSADLTVRATANTWQLFWQHLPPPGYHDLMAMSSYGHCRIEGNMALLRTHLGFIKSLMAAPRRFLPTVRPAEVVQ